MTGPAPLRLVLLAGMHRSGTSAAARAFNLCGVPLPDDLLAPADSNPSGHWEPRAVVQLHDEALAAAGRSWRDPRPFPADWFDSEWAAGVRYRLWQAIEPELARKRMLLVKDPRLCRLLPLWCEIAAHCGLALHCVLPVRHPLEVAASLQQRDAMPQPEALLLWLRHALEAERASRGLPRSFLAYDHLLRDGAPAVRRAAARAGIALPQPLETDAAIATFLDPAYQHHRCGDAELEHAPQVPPWVKATYAYLAKAAADGAEPPAAALDAVHAALRAADLLFAPVQDRLESALAETARLASELAGQQRQAARLHGLAEAMLRQE